MEFLPEVFYSFLLITTGVVVKESSGVSMNTANFLSQMKLSYPNIRKSLDKTIYRHISKEG